MLNIHEYQDKRKKANFIQMKKKGRKWIQNIGWNICFSNCFEKKKKSEIKTKKKKENSNKTRIFFFIFIYSIQD